MGYGSGFLLGGHYATETFGVKALAALPRATRSATVKCATGGAASETCPFAFPWNVTGWPAISVPAGLTASGLPIGAQFLAHEGQEGLLLALARQLEPSS